MLNRERKIFLVTTLVSLVGHVSLIEGLGYAARLAPKQRRRPIEFAVLTSPPALEPKLVEIKKKDIPKKRRVKEPPPSNTQEQEIAPEQAKPVFGISMSSVVGPETRGGMIVRVGNTLMKDPEEEFTAPKDVQRYAKPIPLHKVNRMPRRIGACKADYPKEAKVMGIEGRVKLSIDIDVDGRVGEVRLLAGLGYGLDESALRALKQCKFVPAMMGGDPVPTRIPYVVTFILEE